MSFDELAQQLDALESEQREFCDECPHLYDCGGTDYAYGAPIHVPEYTCRACFDPEDSKCPEHAEYMGLLADIEGVEHALDVLDGGEEID